MGSPSREGCDGQTAIALDSETKLRSDRYKKVRRYEEKKNQSKEMKLIVFHRLTTIGSDDQWLHVMIWVSESRVAKGSR